MAEDVKVTAVPPEHVVDMWPKVSHYVADAVQHTHGRFETDDVLDMILDESHTLWVAYENRHVKGAVVTTIMEYPRRRLLGCPFVTGEEFPSWKGPMLEMLQRWAIDNGCEGIESTARLGWARVFKDDGYAALWQTFELPVVAEAQE